MKCFFYNTDSDAHFVEPLPRFPVLIDGKFAALGGDKKRFGDQFLKLSCGNILLMYQNGLGIVAVGRVLEEWDEKSYSRPKYYNIKEMGGLTGGAFEYRLPVHWFLNLESQPVSLQQLRKHIQSPRFTPRGAIRPIVKHRDHVVSMLEEMHKSFPVESPPATDMNPPDRIKTTTYRVLRDTAKAVYVKELHRYKCQICGHRITLPSGKFYAEAHHIHPLGKPYRGPDSIENIICLCPNHHAELDYGVRKLSQSDLRKIEGHSVHSRFITYHNREIFGKKRN